MNTEIILLFVILALNVSGLILALRRPRLSATEELEGNLLQLRDGIRTLGAMVTDEGRKQRADMQTGLRDNREEIARSVAQLNAMVAQNLQLLSDYQRRELRGMNERIAELSQTWNDAQTAAREEQSEALRSFEEALVSSVGRSDTARQESFDRLVEEERRRADSQNRLLAEFSQTVDGRLERIQRENREKLGEMQELVGEKLQKTVEERFNESFRIISDRLEQVHRGLGEMQRLATDVGDLRKVLSNVKTRGTIGEIQLGSILEEMLSPGQYEKNAHPVRGSREVVEYAVRLPGPDGGNGVLLPVDSKFPVEDYRRLTDAMEAGETPAAIESLTKAFEAATRKNAKDIRRKYIHPPETTDFALMFVPTEGLYAEILRRPGLFESLQREEKVTVVGPSNLSAFLNSLQMGFRTLAIQKRSAEVWKLLSSVKREFSVFGEALDKARTQLETTVKRLEEAGRKSRTIEKKLAEVQSLPQGDQE